MIIKTIEVKYFLQDISFGEDYTNGIDTHYVATIVGKDISLQNPNIEPHDFFYSKGKAISLEPFKTNAGKFVKVFIVAKNSIPNVKMKTTMESLYGNGLAIKFVEQLKNSNNIYLDVDIGVDDDRIQYQLTSVGKRPWIYSKPTKANDSQNLELYK